MILNSLLFTFLSIQIKTVNFIGIVSVFYSEYTVHFWTSYTVGVQQKKGITQERNIMLINNVALRKSSTVLRVVLHKVS